MTATGNSKPVADADLEADAVMAYLEAHPDIFEQRPEVLARLSLPHASGSAISLIERQLQVLRTENTRLKTRLDQLLTTARQNERLNGNIHALALALMNAVGPQAVFARLDARLREDFGADHVATRIFAATSAVEGAGLAEFVGRDAPARTPFSDLLQAGETRCGMLDDDRHEALFNTVSGRLSAVMMPLGGVTWDGLLVIASSDSDRYRADMGTEFLTYLKDVVSLVVDPWVKRVP